MPSLSTRLANAEMLFDGAGTPPYKLPRLTTTTGVPEAAGSLMGLVIPLEVTRLIEHDGQAAMRAWRKHRGLSLQTLQRRTRLPLATLESLDRGDVALCEWTVEAVASALEIEPRYLLRTMQRARPVLADENAFGAYAAKKPVAYSRRNRI